jgi:hypothetical protein
MESKHVSTHIDRPLEAVYEYASDPANLPEWAPGLLSSIERDGDHWVAESPMGRIKLVFTPKNEYGVLDHDVTVASGETFHNPMRVLPDGDGCELVFTVRRQAEMSDEDFERDWKAVLEDLVAIKRILEN